MGILASFLGNVKLARVQSHKNMVMFPLLAPPDDEQPGYISLEQGINQGSISIREVGEVGRVPDILLVNATDRPVLILDGEELVGARQNWIVNTTILARAKSEVLLPVGCVEQGRGQFANQRLGSDEPRMSARLTVDQRSRVFNGPAGGQAHCADQEMVLEDLQQKANSKKRSNPAKAMPDLFQAHEEPLLDYLRTFRRVDCQLGGLFAVHGRIIGMEFLGHQDTFTGFFEKLVRSYAQDALEWSGEAGPGRPRKSERVRTLIEQMASSTPKTYPGVGLGDNLRFETSSLTGSALVHEEKVLHLAAFSRQGGAVGAMEAQVKFQRASARRRRALH